MRKQTVMKDNIKTQMSIPPFYCENYMWHGGHVFGNGHKCPDDCKKQCDRCINIIIEHHKKNRPTPRLLEDKKIISLFSL